MQLTVLGCSGPYPAANGACSGYLVTTDKKSFLMDCGSGVLGNLAAVLDPAELDAIIISHLHADHCSDMLVLKYYLERIGKSIPVYLPYDDSPMFAMLRCGAFKLHDISSGAVSDDFCISTLKVNHPVSTYAIRIDTNGKRLAYTGDTNLCPGLDGFCIGADVLISDACFPEVVWNENLPHMSAAHAADLARKCCVKRLILTHFCPAFDVDTLVKEARKIYWPAEAAYPSMRVQI